MAKKRFWLGMLVMALALGMAVVGCDDGITDDDNLMGYIEIDNYYPIVGETITATWTGDDPGGTPKWEWFREGTSIGGNRSSYTVVAADIGNIIKVQVSFSGSNGLRETSVRGVLNTPATATVSISSMTAYRIFDSYYVDVVLILSDGRWNPDMNRFDVFDSLVTLSGMPSLTAYSASNPNGWLRSSLNTFGMGSSFTITYAKSLDSIPSINLTATIDPTKVSGIRSSTNVYNSLTVGTPSQVSVSEWTLR